MKIRTSWGEQAERAALPIPQGSLILRLLKRRVGEVPESLVTQIESFPTEQLEALGEALLDFANLTDLERWLMTND